MRRITIIGFIVLSGFLIIRSFKAQTSDTYTDNEIISPVGEGFSINTLGTNTYESTYTIYGYLPYWTISEADNFRLDLLTDISYFGLEIDGKGNIIKTKINSEGEETNHSGYWVWKNDQNLEEFLTKAKNKGIRNSISIISHIDDVSTEFLHCEECWDNFYENIKPEMLAKDLKDINLNFEYYNLVEEETALQFTKFTEYLKKKMRKDFPSGEIVVTAFADSIVNSRITHIPTISKVADKIFIMAYDFHVKPDGLAAPVSPMGGAGVHAGYDIRTMIKDYLTYVPPQKLILGVPYYGFNWGEDEVEESLTEEKEEDSKEESSNSEEAQVNTSVKTSLTQTYAQIMKKKEESEINVQWDELGQVPYYEYSDPETGKLRKVYFENERSLRVKYKIAKEFDLGGIGIWALGYDEDRPELWNVLHTEFYFTTGGSAPN